MSDFIFTKEVMLKSAFYTRIKEILIAAGWQSISSRPSSDLDVFYSEGEDGNRGLYFNMKEYGSTVSSTLSNSNQGYLFFRLIKGYTPSQTVGQAGTFDRNESWRGINIGSMVAQTPLTVYYHCNRNRLIVVVDPPSSLFTNSNPAICFLIGVPDRTFGIKAPKQDLVLAGTFFDGSTSGNIYVTDQADNPRNSSYAVPTHDAFSSFPSEGRSMVINKTFFFGEIAYGNTTEGIRGILDGIYLVKEPISHAGSFWLAQFKHGDEFIDDEGKRYKIFLSTSNVGYYSSFSSKYFAIRIG